MKTPFLKPFSPFLKKVSEELTDPEISSTKIQGIIEKMFKIAFGQQKDKSKPLMVGLAAPQIGIFKRIILVDISADGKGKVGNLRIYINPKITWKSKKETEWYEGCYSTGRVCGIISRPTSIKIQAYTLKSLGVLSKTPPRWKAIEEKYSGYIARIFQHEIDHLNGKLFTDCIRNPNNLHWVDKSEFPLYRNRGAWRNWPRKYSPENGEI